MHTCIVVGMGEPWIYTGPQSKTKNPDYDLQTREFIDYSLQAIHLLGGTPYKLICPHVIKDRFMDAKKKLEERESLYKDCKIHWFENEIQLTQVLNEKQGITALILLGHGSIDHTGGYVGLTYEDGTPGSKNLGISTKMVNDARFDLYFGFHCNGSSFVGKLLPQVHAFTVSVETTQNYMIGKFIEAARTNGLDDGFGALNSKNDVIIQNEDLLVMQSALGYACAQAEIDINSAFSPSFGMKAIADRFKPELSDELFQMNEADGSYNAHPSDESEYSDNQDEEDQDEEDQD